jgi:glutamate carboxypeptidase
MERIARYAPFAKLSIALAVGLLVGAAQAAPDAALLAAANKEQPALIDSLKQMTLIETGSGDADGLAKLANLIDDRLKANGFKTERIKTTVGAGADIVVGTKTGTGKRKIMLQSHMDTVYPSGILESQPLKQDGNRLYGPGIADDKGGVAVILHTTKILADAGWKDYATFTVMINPDEEVGSRGSRDTIMKLADQNDVVLSFEPSTAKDVAKGEPLTLGAAGIATATMEVKGRAAHAGAAPELGRNALIELAYQMLQTKDLAKDIPGATLNWDNARATQALNQIPPYAVALGDVRVTQTGAEDKLRAALEAKVASGHLVPDTQTTVKLELGRPAFVASPAGRALAERARAIYAEIDRPLEFVPMIGGGTDAGYANKSGKAVVLESFGLPGFGYHARDEYIEIDSIVPRLYLATRILMDIGKQMP